jgi:hypothetical protein
MGAVVFVPEAAQPRGNEEKIMSTSSTIVNGKKGVRSRSLPALP